MKAYWPYSSPVGMLWIAENGSGITDIFGSSDFVPPASAKQETPLLKAAAEQLAEYFAGTRRQFSLPLCPQGTPFQLRVWQALRQIPYGETRSYQQIAVVAGNPKACRAVGMANNRNPIMIVVPCHRVIGKDGSLTGFGGGLEMKAYLLDLEKRVLAEGRER